MDNLPTTKLDWALWWATMGFYVFPLIPGGKLPLIEGWQDKATTDEDQIRAWWMCGITGWPQNNNIGVSTSKYDAGLALWVVDVDNKGAKRGNDELIRLELAGKTLPPTLEQITPTGGRHLIYVVDEPVRQGANVLAPGLDIRSRGGFVVGAGSETERGSYALCRDTHRPGRAPAWYIEYAGGAVTARSAGIPDENLPEVSENALLRVIHYLENEAPLAVEGAGGDHTTYAVACRVKDLGVSKGACLDLLLEHWNARCSPPWQTDELAAKVRNAYAYGREPIGSATPEAQFEPLAAPAAGSPLEALNAEYAFVLAGGGSHIIWETTDANGQFALEHLNEGAFHRKLASKLFLADGQKRSEPLTEAWMRWAQRRSYDGLCFLPGKEAPPRFYNLWRGFAVKPWPRDKVPSPRAKAAVDAFLSHARENVCGRDKDLARWLLGFLAHMVQRPDEKPLVALVFRGAKGVGKNALIERFGHLLGSHFLITNNRRYLVGNFNSHLERLLCFVLNEAFWSGDKPAEGVLKDLITGATHVIEPKGEKVYTVDNKTRVVIIGNEDWIVPASHDERRFAVFNVGEGRKQDRAFFAEMKHGMEAGGYELLLRYFLDFDLRGLDFNAAPATQGLLDQKHASLDPLYQWWLDCLTEGKIVGSDFGDVWPENVETERLRAAFHRYAREMNVRSRYPSERSVGHQLRRCAPGIANRRIRSGPELANAYVLPPLAESRAAWEQFIGHRVEWNDENA